jgi:hypothetical protein
VKKIGGLTNLVTRVQSNLRVNCKVRHGFAGSSSALVGIWVKVLKEVKMRKEKCKMGESCRFQIMYHFDATPNQEGHALQAAGHTW